MSRIEGGLRRQWSGTRIMIGSLLLGLLGFMPLQLYIWFGPRDGNPIGLGLLAMLACPLAALGVAVGFGKLLVELVQRARK